MPSTMDTGMPGHDGHGDAEHDGHGDAEHDGQEEPSALT
jgi:hypothetical protein